MFMKTGRHHFTKCFYAVLVAFVLAVFWPGVATAVEINEFSLTLQGGGLGFDGKLGDLFADDLAYGAAFVYGFSDNFALVFDFLYSEHEQSDRDEYGELSMTHATAALGVRASYTFSHVMPYLDICPLASFAGYEAKYDAGSDVDTDSLDSHGFGGMGTAGFDVFIADGATLGLAGRVGMVDTDMDFATGADIDNEINTYTYYAGIVRLSILY